MKIEGKPYRPAAFAAYLAALPASPWQPSLIVIHHCVAPSLSQRPKGFTAQHMLNLQDYYEKKGWSAGPHLFVDDDEIWTFSPLTARGVHAPSFNATGIGIEMLGDYDLEDPWSGRGLAVLTTTCQAVKLLMAKFHLPATAIRFHRDDPKTAKTDPGIKITKNRFLKLLRSFP
jgi:hypothetical protein